MRYVHTSIASFGRTRIQYSREGAIYHGLCEWVTCYGPNIQSVKWLSVLVSWVSGIHLYKGCRTRNMAPLGPKQEPSVLLWSSGEMAVFSFHKGLFRVAGISDHPVNYCINSIGRKPVFFLCKDWLSTT